MSNQSTPILEQHASRREVMKKAAYMAPAILTLAAIPAFAAKGSGWKNDKPKKPRQLLEKYVTLFGTPRD
jgi:hypothetical protein